MASLFADTDRLICSALGIQRREQLNDRALLIDPLSEETAIRLVDGLYERRFADAWEETYPKAVACLRNDLDDLLT